MNSVNFTVPFAAAWKRVKQGRQGTAYNPSSKDEKIIAQYALVARVAAQLPVWQGPCHVHVTFYGLEADVDNALKLCLDGMNGIVYQDDSQVILATVQKIAAAENQRMDIEVEALAEPEGKQGT